jgi:hypothetical protein
MLADHRGMRLLSVNTIRQAVGGGGGCGGGSRRRRWRRAARGLAADEVRVTTRVRVRGSGLLESISIADDLRKGVGAKGSPAVEAGCRAGRSATGQAVGQGPMRGQRRPSSGDGSPD